MTMLVSPRSSQFRVVRSAWKKQTDIDTPIPLNEILTAFNLADKQVLQIEKTREAILDCSGQFRLGYRSLTKLGRLPMSIEIDPTTLAGLLAFACGKAAAPSGNTSAITILDDTEFDLPMTSFVTGFKGGASPGQWFQSAVLNELRFGGRIRERMKATADWVGRGDRPPATGFSYPNCSAYTPLLLSDGALSINSVEYLLKASNPPRRSTQFEMLIQNKALTSDDPFTLGDDQTHRMQRADLREWQFNWKVEGEESDSLHSQAVAEDEVEVIWRIGGGPDSTPPYVVVTAPVCIMREDATPSNFEGEANRNVLNIVLEPKKVSGDATTPFTVSAVMSNSTPFLG